MARIVAVGGTCQDIILIDRDDFSAANVAGQSIFAKLTSGSTAEIDQLKLEPGGSALNAAVSFARAGHETILIGNIARDSAGEAILTCLDEENIDSSYMEYHRGHTACSVILVDAKTRCPTRLEFQGVNYDYDDLPVEEDLERISPDWLYVSSLSGKMEKILELFETARRIGAKIMFNPGPAELAEPDKVIGLLEDVDVLLVNKSEAARLVPGVLLTELLVHLAAYCPTVIITDGEMGAIATDHAKTYRLGIYEQARVRDITGAGDAFGAGFLAHFAANQNFRRALHFASANATSVIGKYGARTGVLSPGVDLHPMPIQLVTDLI